MRDVPVQRISPGDPTGKDLPNRPLQQFFSFEPDNEAVGGDGLFVSKDTEIFGGGDVPGEANGFGNRFRASSAGGHDDHWGLEEPAVLLKQCAGGGARNHHVTKPFPLEWLGHAYNRTERICVTSRISRRTGCLAHEGITE